MSEQTVDKYNEALSRHNFSIIDSEIDKSVRLITEKTREYETIEVYKKILSIIDLTSLNVTDNDDSILALTEKVNDFTDKYADIPNVAAICVYPRFAKLVSQSLEADDVKVVCVAGGFPSSQTFPEIKIAETSLALRDGADEIDIVINVGMLLNGDYETLCDEIEEIKSVCGEKRLKVILETGALGSTENIIKAALLAMYSGADFIKTSTGKEKGMATPESVYVMCKVIKDYYDTCGKMVGIKPSGGIKSVEDALIYYSVVKEVLGEKWLDKNFFRIGASSLTNQILTKITKENKFRF